MFIFILILYNFIINELAACFGYKLAACSDINVKEQTNRHAYSKACKCKHNWITVDYEVELPKLFYIHFRM